MPCIGGHAVHIYAESDDLIVHLSGIVASSLVLGHAVVIVATETHQQLLLRELLNVGIDVQHYSEVGLYVMCNAEEKLASFMVDGMPDANLFRASIGGVLTNIRESSRINSKAFTIFGEMVALLWDRGNHAAALRLEELWNEILKEFPIRLHCGYPRQAFRQAADLHAVCALHSSVLHLGSASLPNSFAAD